MPAGEVKTRLRATVPLEEAVPEDRVRESVWAKETRLDSRKVTKIIDLIRRLIICFFIVYSTKVLERPFPFRILAVV